jgi:hypothetical protein
VRVETGSFSPSELAGAFARLASLFYMKAQQRKRWRRSMQRLLP